MSRPRKKPFPERLYVTAAFDGEETIFIAETQTQDNADGELIGIYALVSVSQLEVKHTLVKPKPRGKR